MSLSEALLSRAQANSSLLAEKGGSSAFHGGPKGGLAAFLARSRTTPAGAGTNTTSKGQGLTSVQIASFHAHKTLPPVNYASQATTQLVRSVRQLLSSNASNSTATASRPPLEHLYSITNTLIIHSSRQTLDDLYDTIRIEFERAAGSFATALHSSGSANESLASKATWLTQLQSIWSNWCENLALVRDVLLPLDRYFLQTLASTTASEQSKLPIWDLGLDIFGHRILKDATLASMILTRIVAAIDGERQQSISYRELHASVADMFRQLKAESVLDEAIATATVSFYQAESTAAIAELSPTDYVEYADRRIHEEQQRSEWALLTQDGRAANVAAARKQLVTEHADKILAGLPDLITAKQLSGLAKIYQLVKSIDRLSDLRKAFAEYIKTHGASIVNDRARDDDMIERLLEFKSFIDAIVSTGFQRDGDFVHAQKDSFEVFVNKRENKPAELIAKFLDAKLRSGNKTMTDQELEHNLDEALILFRYTHAKDMFEEFYKRHFAKRLLLNRSASSDAERSMLLKLKEECGPEFTAKLETMIKDVDVSKDLMDEFERFATKQRKDQGSLSDDFDLSVSVLTQAHWPTYPNIEVTLPTELAAAAERFEAFYQKRNSGRRLHWQHSLGTLSITTQFDKAGVKELQVSTFQAIVLLLFNSLSAGEKLSYVDIRTQTGLNDQELKRTLQSLACGQIPTRVLRKHPQGKEVNDDDEFVFNDHFKNERHRIRINQIQMKETAEEQKSTEQRVFLDRELILQAAAVRVLKAKKTIKHSELVNEVVEQIKSRFTIERAEIKKVFDILIEKEYMERVEGERATYRYLA
ncbi:Cullin, N-terminal [Kalmanozyma brasiliensis GHG001]|uniref:Cullin family profile domain-containing protein n=1 Tax=Kalmanozyma brasiliensis (strain GHG001) TaxID=1365824 RepID=V5ESZ3_KALBG|nr:Cullin, N-terminal [Kalmanozyma brasiliensis GHG001]EST08365.1 Cullin, N-terminal [Kalmanozyma brasiliensis GHG001]